MEETQVRGTGHPSTSLGAGSAQGTGSLPVASDMSGGAAGGWRLAAGQNPTGASGVSNNGVQSQQPAASSQQRKLPKKATTLESLGDASTPPPADDTGVELPDLSPQHIAFLTSLRYQESNRELVRQFGLTEDDLSFLNEMDHAVFGGMISLKEYVAALRGEFPNLNNEEKTKLIAHLLAYRFEPFENDLKPSALTVAKEEGLNLPPAPYYRVYTKPLTYRGAAHEIARMAGISFMGQAQERLRDALISRVKGIRTDAQVEEQLSRSPEQGGLGVDAEAARKARESMEELISRAKLVSEDQYAEWLNRGLHPVEPPKRSNTAEEERVASTPLQEDEEREIADIVARMPAAEREQASVLAESVKAILERLSWRPDDAYLQRRLTNAISTRLRDVRSKNELLMKMMRDVKVGGLGLERKEAEKVSEEIEQGYAEFRDKVAGEEEKRIKEQLVEQERKIEERRRKEAEEHARWYEEKVKHARESDSERKRLFEKLKVVAMGKTTPMHPVEEKSKAKERAAFGELVPAPAPRAVTPPRPVSPPPAATSEKKTPVPPPRKAPEKPVVKVSSTTASMQKKATGTRPSMDDVTPTHVAISGPLQEIGGMTLEQFRRLASSPTEAAERVKEKVNLLAEESFEKHTAGIQAWHGSPIQKLYLSLVTEAFTSGKPVKALAEEKRASDPSVPTSEELDAIVALNGELSLR